MRLEKIEDNQFKINPSVFFNPVQNHFNNSSTIKLCFSHWPLDICGREVFKHENHLNSFREENSGDFEMINKKMQNWKLVNDKIIFKNYLFNLSNKDFERRTNHYRHFIRIFDISNILKNYYLEIKDNIPKKQALKFLMSKLNTPKSSIECWISGRNPIPIFKAYMFLKEWKKVCKKSKEELNEKWNEIFFNTKLFSVCGSQNGRVKLPKELTEDLAYIIGFILADGYIKNDDKLLNEGKYPEYTIALYTNSKQFLQNLERILFNLFKVKCNIYYSEDKKGSWYTLRCCSKPIHRFFCDVLGLKRGVKTGDIDVPDIISDAPKRFQKAFISGFFDGDGGVGITSKNPWLELGQTSITKKPIPIILWLQNKLKDFEINFSLSKAKYQNLWRLRTGSKNNILNFYNIISSRHPDKVKIYKKIEGFSYNERI